MSEAKASIDKQTVEQVAKFGGEHYKYGFTTEIDVDRVPNGLNEDIIRFISAKKGRAAMAAGMASRRV